MAFYVYSVLEYIILMEIILLDSQVVAYVVYRFWNLVFLLYMKYATSSVGQMLLKKVVFPDKLLIAHLCVGF